MYKNCIHCFARLGEEGVCPRCGFENSGYLPEPHHLPPETILHGRYVVGIALGEGGFGITYAGYDLVLMRKVAIKEYFPGGVVWRDLSKSLDVSCYTSQNFHETFEVGRQKCIHEAQSLAKLDDIPAIVRILDFFSENNTAYIIMEFVEGVTLKDYVRRLSERMMLPEILELLQPVTDALEKVHKRGFVHRDISPDNIMITQDGTAKLLDFGAVKAVASGGSATEHPVVKRGFSPLELYSTEGLIGAWTDVYALAATICYLLIGTPLPEPTDRLINDDTPQKLDGLCSPMQITALLKGIAIQPQARQQTVVELVHDLRKAPKPQPESESELISEQYNETDHENDDKNKKRLLAVVASVALVAIVATGSVAMHRSRSAQTDIAALVAESVEQTTSVQADLDDSEKEETIQTTHAASTATTVSPSESDVQIRKGPIKLVAQDSVPDTITTTVATTVTTTAELTTTATQKNTRIVCDPQSLTVRRGFSKKVTARFYGFDSVGVQHGEGSYGMESSVNWDGDCYVVTVKVKGSAVGSGSVDFILKTNGKEEIYHYPITIE